MMYLGNCQCVLVVPRDPFIRVYKMLEGLYYGQYSYIPGVDNVIQLKSVDAVKALYGTPIPALSKIIHHFKRALWNSYNMLAVTSI